MAIRYYDDALIYKLKKWIPENTNLRVLKPDESKRLFELADTIEEIKSRCSCGKKASINARFNQDKEIVLSGDQILVGGNDLYKPLCRKCWLKLVNNTSSK